MALPPRAVTRIRPLCANARVPQVPLFPGLYPQLRSWDGQGEQGPGRWERYHERAPTRKRVYGSQEQDGRQ